jgi:hypothetical protein
MNVRFHLHIILQNQGSIISIEEVEKINLNRDKFTVA